MVPGTREADPQVGEGKISVTEKNSRVGLTYQAHGTGQMDQKFRDRLTLPIS